MNKIIDDSRERGEKELQLKGQELNKFVLEQFRLWEVEERRRKVEERENKRRQEEDERENKKRQEENERENKRRQEENEREDKRRQEAADIRKHEMEIEKIRLETEKYKNNEGVPGGKTDKNRNYHLLKNLLKYEKSNELDEYIDNFEHIAQQNKVPKEEWLAELQVRVTGDLQAFLLTEDVRKKYHDYDAVKALILTHAGYSSEKYRGKWNNLRPQGDNFREYHSVLARSLDNWVASTGTDRSYEGLRDLVCRNKLLTNMNPEILKTVLLNKPTSCESVLTQIDTIKATGQDIVTNSSRTSFQAGGVAKWGVQNRTRRRSAEGRLNRELGGCFVCGREGHWKNNCPRKQGNREWTQAGTEIYRGRREYARDPPQRYNMK